MQKMKPSDRPGIDRRTLVAGATGTLGTLLLGGCEPLSDNPTVQQVLGSATRLTRVVQRLIGGAHPLAPEYTEADLSPHFKSNGTSDPDDDDYQQLAANGFVDWRLQVDGLVRTPTKLSLDDLRAMPSRTQITRHDCVEGWSCIGKWKGVPLAEVMRKVDPQPSARYAVFHCADPMESGNPATKYYESIDLAEASHPQTILAYEMNDKTLPVAHGAPIRLRVERQLGYKMAKYVMRIELVEGYAHLGDGKGGYWEDQGYAWYAGI
jgi:DMSO/TMAO reductase YedYZ molybdopterin-dependent catalytic subunit